MKVARLVCEAFNGPPDSGQQAMHDDENSRNNHATNLKWGSNKENLNYPGYLDYCRSRTGSNSPYRKGKVRQLEEMGVSLTTDLTESTQSSK